MSRSCATCGALVGDDSLLSDQGEPICPACSARADLEREEKRASQAIFASSGSALALGVIALAVDPCFLTSIFGVAAGMGTLSLLARHPEHRARLGGRAWVAGIAAVLGMGLAVAAPFVTTALQVYFFTRRADPAPTPVEEEQAEEEARAEEDPARQIFAHAIPHWVIALDARTAGSERAAPRDVASTHAAVLAAVDRTMPERHDAFARFLDDAESYAARGNDTDAADLTNSMVLLDSALERGGIPYYVDALLVRSRERQRVLASSYAIEQRRHYRSGEQRITALDLDRIDTLSFDQTLLGYTRPDVRVALVLTARVDRFLVQRVLPSIHSTDESVIVRGYEHETNVAWITGFEESVHVDLRREAATLAPERDVLDLASAIVRRRVALDALDHEIATGGGALREPDAYDYDVAALSAYAGRATPFTLRDVRSAQHDLEEPRLRAAWTALRTASLDSIARHEAQHRIDFEQDLAALHVPDALARYVGRTEHEDAVNELAERSNLELSAYTAQVARDPERVRTVLVHVIQFAMSRNDWGRPECYAALVLFEALADALEIAHEELVVDRTIRRERLAQIYEALRERPSADLAEAASRAWTALYGAPLAPLELE